MMDLEIAPKIKLFLHTLHLLNSVAKNDNKSQGKKKRRKNMGNDHSSNSSQQNPQYPKTNPLMNAAQRSKCSEIFENQFKTNENFLRDAILLKLRMKGKLLKIRQKLLVKKQQQQQEEGEGDADEVDNNAPSPTTQALFAAAPIPSFANFADASSVEHRPTREEKIRDGCVLLKERIQNLQFRMEIMADDGNCQFRAIAHQLYNGDQDGWHGKVRETVVAYMHHHGAEFNFLFEDEKEFNRYLGGMAKARTWGDELTLKAAANAYNVNIHVLTSEKEHYYVCYRSDQQQQQQVAEAETSPKAKNNTENNNQVSKNSNGDNHGAIDIFLAYISPIHYNSIRIVSE